MRKRNLLFHPAIYLAFALYIALSFAVLAMGNNVIAFTVPEDQYFEVIGSLALLATSLVFFHGFRVARKTAAAGRISIVKQLVFLALALLFLFGAGEEISWGQRILGFQTPESLAEVNTQDEFNAHNLATWQNSGFLDANRLFDVFWFVFAVAIPLLAMLAPSFRRFASRFLPVIHWAPGLFFVYTYLWAKLAKILFAGAYRFDAIPLTQAVQEIKESNYALIFVLVGLFAVWHLHASHVEAPSPAPQPSENVRSTWREESSNS
jgi:hypothetical protein